MKLKLAIACLLLALTVTGCSYMPWSSSEIKPDPTAEALFKEGTDYFNKENYVLAIDRFNRVRTDFPFSPLVTDAELKLAESYYKNEQYPEAIASFREFQALHPTNENIPFVIYTLGMAHLAQFTAIDRDQKLTKIAKGYFETVIKNHPQSPYAARAEEKLTKCKKYLAEHEFNIATFYIREKNYLAARARLEGILRDYPDTPTAAKSIYHLGQTYQNEKNSVRAALAYKALLRHYPGSPFTEEAKNNLVKLEKEKEKQDPLAMLLMRDGRPVYAPPPPPGRIEGNGDGTGGGKEKLPPKLFAKKEIVYEEPGDEKGLFRSVVDTLNPFSSSSDETETDGKEGIETAQENSNGSSKSFWSSLNPFASQEKTEVEIRKNAGLMEKVDESLKEKGVEAQDGGQWSKPPASDLPQKAAAEEESKPPAANPAVVLEKVDGVLQQEGKETDGLPPTPEISPALQVSSPSAEEEKPRRKADPTPARSSAEVMTDIDRALQQKGIEVPEIKPPEVTAKPAGAGRGLDRPREVELDTNVEFKKGPLFLEDGDYKLEQKAEESEQQEPERSPVDAGELPKDVVTGPPQLEEKEPTEEKAPSSEPSFEEEENRSAWDQIRDDLENARKALNPFSW